MESPKRGAACLRDQACELRAALAVKIALFIGSAENRATDIPGPDAPPADSAHRSLLNDLRAERDGDWPGTKRVDLGGRTFIYDASRYLLTSVDLPIISRVIEASEEAPCLALSLKSRCR